MWRWHSHLHIHFLNCPPPSQLQRRITATTPTMHQHHSMVKVAWVFPCFGFLGFWLLPNLWYSVCTSFDLCLISNADIAIACSPSVHLYRLVHQAVDTSQTIHLHNSATIWTNHPSASSYHQGLTQCTMWPQPTPTVFRRPSDVPWIPPTVSALICSSSSPEQCNLTMFTINLLTREVLQWATAVRQDGGSIES